MLDEVISAINIQPDQKNIIVDGTLGLGGHARAIIGKMGKGDIFIWFDADEGNLQLAQNNLIQESEAKWVQKLFIHSNFRNLKMKLEEQWITEISGIYLDLWVSSVHLDDPEKWFSFKQNWPLDMRFEKTWGTLTASEVVNYYEERDLFMLFQKYGEEPMSRRIASEIVKQRKETHFETTKQLADCIETVSKFHKSKNRIFQALRIEVNDELWALTEVLNNGIELLQKWWVFAVITFHSLEDRIVKQLFKKETRDCICRDIICTCHHEKCLRLINKKPILPQTQEIEENQRSRSAKLRIAEKIK